MTEVYTIFPFRRGINCVW